LLAEVAGVLCDVRLATALDREALWRLLERSGATRELTALENCLLLARSKAG
jgi:hypothetical protein